MKLGPVFPLLLGMFMQIQPFQLLANRLLLEHKLSIRSVPVLQRLLLI
jgi:hypothetical protein